MQLTGMSSKFMKLSTLLSHLAVFFLNSYHVRRLNQNSLPFEPLFRPALIAGACQYQYFYLKVELQAWIDPNQLEHEFYLMT